MHYSPKTLARISLIALLILGCLYVLYPFLAAVLFAAVVCITTWPAYAWLHGRLGGRDILAASLMTVLLILGMVVPTIFLAAGLGDAVHLLVEKIRPWLHGGIGEPPAWLVGLPVVGEQIVAYWHRLAESREELMNLLRQAYEPVRTMAFSSIGLVGNGILQLVLVIFIGFFLYRDGEAIANRLGDAARRLGGDLGVEMLQLSRNTVTGVMIGIVGTAMAQAVVALLGFWIAGVPGAILLASATFFLSMIPVGPPLIWGGAAFWLYDQGEMGWAIFMAIYGLVVISSVDNFVKPILISRSASLPILLIALGVFGGILAFGFIGIFLGPTLLALAHVLFMRWMHQPDLDDN
ncbi:AI-2E family transporter [Azovibrio restrictus]|uniref:AI-2E family transporter n=1 Tax=Azovibrio restrictus TaxID=146938 RepID=UPI0026EB93A5|nr:AI-2E family transporter [Azovibrio restrictus]